MCDIVYMSDANDLQIDTKPNRSLKSMPATPTAPTVTSPALTSAFPEMEEQYRAHILRTYGPEYEKKFNEDMRLVWSARFDRHEYGPVVEIGPTHRELKISMLDELQVLSEVFPEIPGILWHCIAHVVLREDPTIRVSLLDDAFLFGDAKLNDSALHAAAIVTKLMYYINSHLLNHVGYIVIHACKCDCCIEACSGNVNLEALSEREVRNLSECFFSHFCAEWVKTKVLGLPLAVEY